MYNVFSYDKKEKEKTELLKNNLKEKIYFDCRGGDFFFSFKGIDSLHRSSQAQRDNILVIDLVKKAELQEAVEGGEEDFRAFFSLSLTHF